MRNDIKRRNYLSNYRKLNRNRLLLIQKMWKRNNKDKVKISNRKSKLMLNHSLTLEQFNFMLLKQKGVCKICVKPETTILCGYNKPLSVDHDHKTGKIRGLLCNRCNRALGLFGDNVELLVKAAKYLNGKNT